MWPFEQKVSEPTIWEKMTGVVKCDNCGFEREQILCAGWIDAIDEDEENPKHDGSGYGHHHCGEGRIGTFRRK